MPKNCYISFFLFILLLLSFQPKSHAHSTNNSNDDHQILLGLKQHWGRNSPALSTWNSTSAAHCNWIGVTCTYGAVTGISLSNQSFFKPIPASLCLLKDLTSLNLSYNNFSTSFPISLYNCSNLNYLDLSNNFFVGSLPDDINSLSAQLEHLNLSRNGFTGKIPPSIGWFPKIKSLLLDTNGFNGSYPAEEISNLANLEVLTLANNPFDPAPVSEEFGKLTRLTYLWLSNMQITGEIPKNLSNLLGLDMLALDTNNMQGTIPTWIWQLEKLQYLYLYGNNFTGGIADNITALDLLEVDLSLNKLTGTIPEDFGKLTNLTTLLLYSNQLHGSIPPNIGLLPNLSILNLYMNQLSGEIPTSLQNGAYDLRFNPGLCVSSNSSTHFPICRARSNFTSDISSRRLITLFSVLASITLLSLAVGGFLILRKQKDRQELLPWKLTQFHALHFTEHDILSGLCEQNWIGSGRSGKVYRVHVANEAGAGIGSMVAVKKIWSLQNLDENLEKDFLAEVQILGDIRHKNIVKLLCCISSSQAKFLVYEYMENGSLDRWLHQRERIGALAPLDWPTRLQIAIDSARGLFYMHHGCSPAIVHRDVKSANILLNSEFRAKVADFGLARILLKAGEPESVSSIGGTFGYMPPEYGYQRRVNEKVDIYSFGVVLLELTTGRVANGGGEEYSLAQWAWRQYQENGLSVDLLDDEIKDPAHNEDMLAVFTLAVICTGEQPSMRPSMKDVLHALLRLEHRSGGESLQHADLE